MTDAKSEAFGVRLDAATLARLDAYAERHDRKRGAAAVRAIVAGLDALEGAPPAPPGAPGPVPLDPAPLAVAELAGALYDLLGPMVADAVAAGARRARRPELAPVGVARVVDALRAACEAADCEADREARARLDLAVIGAINVLAYGETPPAGPVATVQPDPDRRTPPPTPRPGGKRKAPVADPADRRGLDRFSDADVGRWVAEFDGRRRAHRLTRIGGGGVAECACGESVDLRFAQIAEDRDRRRCLKCEGL